MDSKVQSVINQVLANHEILRTKMKWEVEANMCAIMGSMIMVSKNATANASKYDECKKILKKNAGVFSEFRGLANAMVITKMAVAENPEEYLKGCMEVYKKLRELHKWTASPFMVMAAMTIFEHGGLARADENIASLEEFYKNLKKAHPFLINDQDRGYLAMLITCGLNPTVMEEKIESNYQACKSLAMSKDSVNSLAQILALSNKKPEENAEEIDALLKALRQRKCYISKYSGLSALGALSLLDMSIEEKADQIVEICEYIAKHRAFKWYNMNKGNRAIFASMILFMANADEMNKEIIASIGETLTMVIVEQVITTIIILCAVSTANSSSSS